ELVECNAIPKKTNKPWTVAVSTVVQCALLGILILIPLIYTEALPKTMLTTLLVAPPPPPPPPPPPAPAQVKVIKPVVRLIQAGKLVAPKAIPKEVNIIKEQELPPDMGVVGVTGGVPGGVPGGQAGGVLGGIIGGTVGSPPPPKETPKRIRLGGQVQQAKLLNRVQPVYPPLAKQARIQGNVVLHAIIAKDGSIQELQVLSGHPLLVQAALDAVRQWRYQPTLLNGDPVEVDTTVTVVFTLSS
ncbi:MAG TPA: TonB family protein, partial [Candidatus Acidoferrales bacterium]|nr:TonB family protein [Candidatus Acidoferrales bacterium]